MVDVNTQNKTISVNVSSSGVSSNVNASGDTTLYYSNKSKEYATSDKLIDGKYRSSKYYSEQAQQSALNAQSFAQSAQDSYKQFQGSVDGALSNIDNSVQTAIATIDTKSNEAIDSIDNTKTTILNDIEFVADGEKKEIEDLIDNGKDEIQELTNEIKDNAEDIINRVGISMFDTITKDHILTYEESKGLALQGTYVYKEALAGSRYGYPDFYNKVVEEFNEATSTETVNGVTVKVHSNGHKFYDIADKTGIDGFFDSYGYAWFYGVDIENERVFLPRNSWFEQATGDISEVGQGIEAGLPYSRIYTETAGLNDYYGNENGNTQYNVSGIGGGSGAILRAAGSQSNFDGLYIQDNNGTYGKSNTVQPPAVKKLLYICVGNTTSYEGITEVVNQGMEILEQVNQGIESRLDTNITNLTDTGKENVIGLLLPDLTTAVSRSNSGFTSDKKQWLLISGTDRGYSMNVFVNGVKIWGLNIGNTSNNPLTVQSWYPLDNGDIVTTVIKQGGSLELKTYSMKGVK